MMGGSANRQKCLLGIFNYIIGFMKALLLLGSSQQELKMSARTKNVSDKITSKLSGIPKVSISQDFLKNLEPSSLALFRYEWKTGSHRINATKLSWCIQINKGNAPGVLLLTCNFRLHFYLFGKKQCLMKPKVNFQF
ncbi:uncharacterized protein [Miscanthus floridulus]|uniref:uncharacterized protein isoform X3 n=1 Tax=Miscanthus floridulus TaxID=154761 RepID=UPI0034585A4C